MSTQTLSLEVKSAGVFLTSPASWLSGYDAPECSIELPPNGGFSIQTASVGKAVVDGDLVLDEGACGAGRLAYRWSSSAAETGSGSGTVTISHPDDDFEDFEVSVEMGDDATLSLKSPKVVQPLTSNDAVNRYGAYAVGFIGAMCALVFAILMPAHRTEIIGAAGAIAVWTFFATSEYDRFVLRILGFVGAGVAMVAAMAMPENADTLISAAGLISAAAIIWGDH